VQGRLRKLVVTTDPLVVKILLQDGGDSCWSAGSSEWDVTMICVLVTLLVGLARLRRINDSVLAERCGGRV
jgi:hypothetical protein